jgi:hypothetical protein
MRQPTTSISKENCKGGPKVKMSLEAWKISLNVPNRNKQILSILITDLHIWPSLGWSTWLMTDNSKHWNIAADSFFFFFLFPEKTRPTETKPSSHSITFTGLFNIRRNAGFVGADMDLALTRRSAYCRYFWSAISLLPRSLAQPSPAQPVGSCFYAAQPSKPRNSGKWPIAASRSAPRLQQLQGCGWWKGLGLDDELAADVNVSVGIAEPYPIFEFAEPCEKPFLSDS